MNTNSDPPIQGALLHFECKDFKLTIGSGIFNAIAMTLSVFQASSATAFIANLIPHHW